MAIKDTTRKPFIEDNDTNVFIGLDLPIRKSDGKEGYFASTSTTIEAVKNNISSLLLTERGERFFQPTLGLNLKKYLFEDINGGLVAQIKEDIDQIFTVWLPFVEISKLEVKLFENDSSINPNTILLNIIFNIMQDPNTLASVSLTVGSSDSTSSTTITPEDNNYMENK